MNNHLPIEPLTDALKSALEAAFVRMVDEKQDKVGAAEERVAIAKAMIKLSEFLHREGVEQIGSNSVNGRVAADACQHLAVSAALFSVGSAYSAVE